MHSRLDLVRGGWGWGVEKHRKGGWKEILKMHRRMTKAINQTLGRK